MATATTTVRRSGSRGRHGRNPSHSGSVPHLTPSFSSSGSSSRSGQARSSSSSFGAPTPPPKQHHRHGRSRPNHHRGGSGRHDHEDPKDMILRGAEMVRAQLQANTGTSRQEREDIKRGAEIIRQQILAQYGADALPSSPDNSSAPGAASSSHSSSELSQSQRSSSQGQLSHGERSQSLHSQSLHSQSLHSQSLHSQSPHSQGQLSHSERSSSGVVSRGATTVKRKNSAHAALRDFRAESEDILKDVESLSHKLEAAGIDSGGLGKVNRSRKWRESAIANSPGLYSESFDPFQEDPSDDERTPPPPPPRQRSRSATPETKMGRDGSLRVKFQEYLVMDSQDDAHDFDEEGDEDYNAPEPMTGRGYANPPPPTKTGPSAVSPDSVMDPLAADRLRQWQSQHPGESRPYTYHSYSEEDDPLRGEHILSPDSAVGRKTIEGRNRLARDRAYQHAVRAGLLWQTLVGEHVRFPKRWWDGARTPPLGPGDGVYDDSDRRPRWAYVSRHRVRGNDILNGCVRHRGSSGRLLLHVVVRDTLTRAPAQDVAIGCFHPNAKGVRQSPRPLPQDEDVREIWMAIRKRGGQKSRGGAAGGGGDGHDGLSMSLIDTALTLGHRIEEVGKPSPIGEKHSVTNENVRAVFGDKPPVETVFVLARDLYRIIIEAVEDERDRGMTAPCPARVLLQEFVFSKR